MLSSRSLQVPQTIHTTTNWTAPAPSQVKQPVLIGGAVIDLVGTPHEATQFRARTSTPGTLQIRFGGVARNVCEVLRKLEVSPFFITAVGDDNYGTMLKRHLQEMGIDTAGVTCTNGKRTACYCAIHDNTGDLVAAIADMDILSTTINDQLMQLYCRQIASASIVFLDGNVSASAIRSACEIASRHRTPVFFEPTSIEKSLLPIHAGVLHHITFIKPNQDEARHMANAVLKRAANANVSIPALHNPSMDDCARILLLEGGVRHVLITMGADGVLWATRDTHSPNLVRSMHSAALPPGQLVNTNGAGEFPCWQVHAFGTTPHNHSTVCVAGDNFVGGFLFGISCGLGMEECIECGLKCAQSALESQEAVNPRLSLKTLFP